MDKIIYGVAILVGLAVVGACLLVLCFLDQFGNMGNYRGDEAVSEIAGYITNPLPDSAYEAHIEIRGWPDPDIAIRFSIPAEDAEIWLMNSGLCFNRSLSLPGASPNQMSDAPDWWHLENRVDGRLSTSCYAGQYDYSIVVDTSEGTHWSFFIDMADG